MILASILNIENPGINPHKMIKYCSARVSRTHNVDRTVFTISETRKNGYPYAKELNWILIL
jgi:hypothetical protein